MALEIKGMTRSFKFKKGTEYITLQLTTATVHGPVIREDMTEYEFKTTIGTKG